MVIDIKEKGTREFYEELVNAMSQYRSLIKKPDMKLRNHFRLLKLYIAICAAFMAALVLMGAFWGVDTAMIVGIVLMVIVIVFSWAYLHRMNNMVKAYLADGSPSVLILDDNGVELNKGGSGTVRLAWDNVAFVRVFSESVVFFAKDVMGLLIGINCAHKQEILDCLKNDGTHVMVIE